MDPNMTDVFYINSDAGECVQGEHHAEIKADTYRPGSRRPAKQTPPHGPREAGSANTRSQTPRLQNCETGRLCVGRHPVRGILLQEPEQ